MKLEFMIFHKSRLVLVLFLFILKSKLEFIATACVKVVIINSSLILIEL